MDAPTREYFATHLSTCADCQKIAGEARAEHAEAATAEEAAAVTANVSPRAAERRQVRPEPPKPVEPEPVTGQRIGRYLVLETLGVGGMGEVLLAYDPALDRRVAVKLAQRRPGDDTLEVRLEREAQALARAVDRHVVTVYDTGKVDGRPYVAMEYVPGSTLKTWLKQPHPRVEILRVFSESARGLAAAHRVGVVHRDFKPDNVLLDKEGLARVTDFGLARFSGDTDPAAELASASSDDDSSSSSSSHSRPSTSASVTQVGAVIGTPAYMSPEQWAAAPLDARTDQFSFCVALHEALLGKRPFAKPRKKGEAPAFERTPESLKGVRELPGPLRLVLTRGLSIDPAARFPTMDALLVEYEKARRPSRVPWFVAGAVLLVLAVSGVAWASRSPCHGALDVISSHRKTQKLEGAALALADSVEKQWAEAWQTACVETHERKEQPPEVLALRNDCLRRQQRRYEQVIDQLVSSEPAKSAAALEALDQSPAAHDCLPVESLLSVEAPPPAKAEEASSLRDRVLTARTFIDLGQYPEARTQLDVLETPVRELNFRRLAAEYAFARGQLFKQEGDLRSAREEARRALSTAVVARDFELAAQSGASLFFIVSRLGFPDEAQLASELTSELVLRTGRQDFEAQLENSRGVLDIDRGRFDDAEAHFKKAVALREAVFGRHHIVTADALGNLGYVARQREHPEIAEPLHREQQEIYEAVLGGGHPKVADALENRAMAVFELGKTAEALALLDRAYRIRRDMLGEKHRLSQQVLAEEALLLQRLEKFDEARTLRTALYDAQVPASLEAANAANELASLELAANRLDAALTWSRTALRAFEAQLGPTEDDVLWQREMEATIFIARKDGKSADAILTSLDKEWRTHSDADSRLADVLLLRARALLLLNQTKSAQAAVDEAQKLYAPLKPERTTRARIGLVAAQTALAAGKKAEAAQLAKDARDLVGDLKTSSEFKELDAWLASHPPP
ncbi:MAG: serine/threonine-protein kinase [Anaeromyxobacter sp.]